MTRRASTELEPCGARHQVKFVVHHQQLCSRNPIVAAERPDRFAGAVHVGGGFEQPERATFAHPHTPDIAEESCFELSPASEPAREMIEKPEAGVVPVILMFTSGVAQAGNDPDRLASVVHSVAVRQGPAPTRTASARASTDSQGVSQARATSSTWRQAWPRSSQPVLPRVLPRPSRHPLRPPWQRAWLRPSRQAFLLPRQGA